MLLIYIFEGIWIAFQVPGSDKIDPDFIRVRTLGIVPDTPLYEAVVRGDFHELTTREILEEEKLLIQHLNVNSQFVSDHMSNRISINGKISESKQEMLNQLDEVLGEL